MQTPAAWLPPDPLPMPIETPRTILRWYELDDAQALHEAVAVDREALLPWLPWGEHEHASPAASAETIAHFEKLRSEGRDYTMGVFEKSSGVLLGGTGLHRIVRAWSDAETGYWLRGDRRREGFCTEATAALITAAFDAWGFRRVRLVCAGANTASQAVPARLGIRLEGREHGNRFVPGHGWDDTLTYGVLHAEWDPAARRVRG